MKKKNGNLGSRGLSRDYVFSEFVSKCGNEFKRWRNSIGGFRCQFSSSKDCRCHFLSIYSYKGENRKNRSRDLFVETRFVNYLQT